MSSIAQFGEIRDSYSEASSQYSLTGASIDQFRQEIAQWLTSEDRNYADVQSVLTSGGDDARTLMAMFDDFNAKSGSNSGWTQISNS